MLGNRSKSEIEAKRNAMFRIGMDELVSMMHHQGLEILRDQRMRLLPPFSNHGVRCLPGDKCAKNSGMAPKVLAELPHKEPDQLLRRNPHPLRRIEDRPYF